MPGSEEITNGMPVILLLTYQNRSGSTFLAQQLSRLENVLVCPESDALVEQFLEDPAGEFVTSSCLPALKQAIQDDPKMKMWDMQDQHFEWGEKHSPGNRLEAFSFFLDRYRKRIKPDADFILFKAERLIHLYPRIRKATRPGVDIRFVSLLRDIRAVYASQKRTPLLPGNRMMSRDPVATALDWNSRVRKTLKGARNREMRYIKYEHFILEFPRSLDMMLSAFGLPSGTQVKDAGDLASRLGPEWKTIHADLEQDAIPGKTDEWKGKLTEKEIFLIQGVSSKWIKKLDYQQIPLPAKTWKYYPLISQRILCYFYRHWRSRLIFHLFRKPGAGKTTKRT